MSSPYTQKTDCYGNTFYCGDLEGLVVPPYPTIHDVRQHARDVKNIELKPYDVIVVGFPKSGVHWTNTVVNMLMTGRTDVYFKTGLGSSLDRTPIISIPPPGPKPRLFFTHRKFSHLPSQVVEKKVKLICLQRNPQDTWVSLYNHLQQHTGLMTYTGAWSHFFHAMMEPHGCKMALTQLFADVRYGNWFDYVLDWERDREKAAAAGVPVFVNTFEDMKRDPVGQTEKLDQFLGYNRGRELCEQIAKVCEFSAMKVAYDGEWQGQKGLFKDTANSCCRKGEVGDWKNWFTVAQRERFDQEFKERMQGSKLRFTFE